MATTPKGLVHRYHLVNGTSGDVKLIEVVNGRPCCGDVRVDKTTLRPGEGADVEVMLRVAEKLGDVAHETLVVTDPPAKSEVVLRTLAKVYPTLRVEELGERSGTVVLGGAAQRWEFRAVAYGSSDEPPVDLDHVGLASLARVEWLGPKQEGAADSGLIVATRRFAVEADPGDSLGRHSVEIALKDGGKSHIEHVVQWEVVPPVVAAPKVAVLSADRPAARVMLRSTDGRPFRVTKVGRAAGVAGTATDSAPATTQVIEVQLDGRPGPDGERGVVSVETDYPGLEAIEVPFVILK